MNTNLTTHRAHIVGDIATNRAERHGLDAQAARQVGHYASTLVRTGLSAGIALAVSAHYARVRRGVACW